MNATALVIVPLSEVLEEMGLNETQAEKAIDKIADYFDSEADGLPEESEGTVSYIEDEDLLKEGLKKAKVDVAKFDEILATLGKENNDLPVYVSI